MYIEKQENQLLVEYVQLRIFCFLYTIFFYNLKEVKNIDKSKFADRLTDLRKEQHMTQADLAKKLNISPQAVSKWETGESIPDIEMLEILSNLYGLTLDELIKGKEATNANKDIVVEEQITAKDVNSKKKQISLLNIVFSSLMLLAFLIFGFSEFYEISNFGYFSLYDILFSLG